MEAMFRENEISMSYQHQIGAYRVYAQVQLQFLNTTEKGLYFTSQINNNNLPDSFLSAIQRGLAACMAYYRLSGIKAILTGGTYNKNDSNEIAFSRAAALALKKYILNESMDTGLEEQKPWLISLGLYTSDENEEEILREQRLYPNHPWARAYYQKLVDSENPKGYLAILRDAVLSGDDLARDLLMGMTTDPKEKFRLMKDEDYQIPEQMIEICKCYEDDFAAGNKDPDGIRAYIQLGKAYQFFGSPFYENWEEKMQNAYERAWEIAETLGLCQDKNMVDFAEELGDYFSDKEKSYYNIDAAIRWYGRAKNESFCARAKLALIGDFDREELLFFGDSYAKGTSALARDDVQAEQYYLRVRTGLVLIRHTNQQAGKKGKYGENPLEAEVEEKLGDLYSRQDSPLLDYDTAIACYKTAALYSPSAKEKAIRLILKKRQNG